MKSIEEEISTGRRRRKKIFARIFVFGMIALFALLAWAVRWFFFQSGYFAVRDIRIVGETAITSEDIMGMAARSVPPFLREIFPADHFLAWPKGAISAADIGEPSLERVFVEKRYKEHLVLISVAERKPYGIWCLEEKGAGNGATGEATSSASGTSPVGGDAIPASQCYWFDRQGVAYREMLRAEGSLIRTVHDRSGKAFSLGAQVAPREFFANIISVFDALRKSGVGVREVRIEDWGLQELSVRTYDGPTLLYSIRFPATYTPSVILSLREKGEYEKLQYIDFRVENRAYYK